MTAREAGNQLIGEVKPVIDEAEELLKATAHDTSEKVKGIRSRLTTAMESAGAACEQFQDKAVGTVQATGQKVRENPYKSIGVAFGIGLLVGVLAGRG